MTNKDIAKTFSLLANLMELHGQNEFKVKTYRNAFVSIRRFPEPIEELPTEAIMDRRGIGKSVAAKVEELLDYGVIQDLEDLKEVTPSGILEMLNVKGLGPKKIKIIWQDMGIEDVTDLMYAAHENRLIEAKGFGLKTQADLLDRLEFYLGSRDKILYASAERIGHEVQEKLAELGIKAVFGGELLRRCNVVDDVILNCHGHVKDFPGLDGFENVGVDENTVELISEDGQEVKLRFFDQALEAVVLKHEVPEFLKDVLTVVNSEWGQGIETTPPPELWDNEQIDFSNWSDERLIQFTDVRGVIHNHSVDSDGSHTIEQMAAACQDKGYEYLVMSDHSRSAFYANGLDEDRIVRQWEVIDNLNAKMTDFRIYKSIESDILYDGSLDYSDDFLTGFDLVIASIHSQLKMEEGKAMERLIRAIEHPATRIIGHMTGRLLLGRKGYPVDHQKIIDACASNNVVIELNANPFRLDMDWRWIQKAQDKGVMISINPDAHHVDGIDDIRYGVLSARKGGLTEDNCLCCKSREEFDKWLMEK